MRIGIGLDVHPLVKNRRLILGGVEISHELGLQGHSDADVLTHAICDALLGAAALGDIGQHFPDTEPAYRDISSLILLGYVKQKLDQTGYKIVNIDSVIIAQRPKVIGKINEMRANIARTLSMPIEQVGVKATTTEKLGFVGREEGIAAQAVVLIE